MRLFLVSGATDGGVPGTHVHVLIVLPIPSRVLLRWIPVAVLVTVPVDQSGLTGWLLVVVVGVVWRVRDAGAGIVGRELQPIGLAGYGRCIESLAFPFLQLAAVVLLCFWLRVVMEVLLQCRGCLMLLLAFVAVCWRVVIVVAIAVVRVVVTPVTVFPLTWVARIVTVLLVETVLFVTVVVIPVRSSSLVVSMVTRIIPLVGVIARVFPIRSPVWIFVSAVIVVVIGVIREGAVRAIPTVMVV